MRPNPILLLGGNDGGRMGSASSKLVTRVARLGSVATGGRTAACGALGARYFWGWTDE